METYEALHGPILLYGALRGFAKPNGARYGSTEPHAARHGRDGSGKENLRWLAGGSLGTAAITADYYGIARKTYEPHIELLQSVASECAVQTSSVPQRKRMYRTYIYCTAGKAIASPRRITRVRRVNVQSL